MQERHERILRRFEFIRGSEQNGVVLFKEDAIKQVAKEFGISVRSVKKILEECRDDESYAEVYLAIQREKNPDYVDPSAFADFWTTGWGAKGVLVGMGVLGLLVVLFLYGGQIFGEKSSTFPKGDGWYCTDKAGSNCYLDSELKPSG